MDETPRQLSARRATRFPRHRADRHARIRVPTLRNLQRVHGDGTPGRAAHDQGDGAPNQNRLGALPQRHRRRRGTPGLDALLPRLLEGLVEPVVVLVGDEVDPHRPLAEVRGSRDRAHRAFGRRSGRAAAGDPGRGVSRPARGGGPRRRPRHLPPPPRRRSRGRASARNGEALACARSWCGVETRRQIGDGLHGLSMAAETRTENRCSGAAPLFLPRAGSQLNIAIDGLVGLGGDRRLVGRGRRPPRALDGPRRPPPGAELQRPASGGSP